MSDDKVQIKFGADAAELLSVMQQVQNTVSQALGQVGVSTENTAASSQQSARKMVDSNRQIQDSTRQLSDGMKGQLEQVSAHFKAGLGGITGGLNSLKGAFVQVSAILAGGAAFKEAIAATTKWTGDIISLSRVLGISTQEASGFNMALQVIGKSAGDFEGMLFKLLRQMKTNEEGMNSLGLVTRNSAGEFLSGKEVFQNALSVLMQYKEGLDRDSAAIYLFGRSAQDVTGYLKLNNEVMKISQDIVRSLGLEIGEDAVAAQKKYNLQMGVTNAVFEAFKISIGKALLPVLVELGGWSAIPARAGRKVVFKVDGSTLRI